MDHDLLVVLDMNSFSFLPDVFTKKKIDEFICSLTKIFTSIIQAKHTHVINPIDYKKRLTNIYLTRNNLQEKTKISMATL